MHTCLNHTNLDLDVWNQLVKTVDDFMTRNYRREHRGIRGFNAFELSGASFFGISYPAVSQYIDTISSI